LPSYYRRERPDIVKYPAALVNYRFTGFLDEVYATMAVGRVTPCTPSFRKRQAARTE